jgi:hypothetical protein
LGINASEIKIAGHLIEEAVDATSAAIHASPTASRLLEASGLHMPRISAPAIRGEKIGSLLTPDKIKTFAEDLFGQLERRPTISHELEDKLRATGWNQSRKQAIAERAIFKAGLNIDGLEGVKDT